MDIEQLHPILDLIEQHGLSVILLFLIIFWLRPKLDRMWSIVLEMRQTIPDPSRESVEELVEINSKIKECLSRLMYDSKCQWAQLWQFHNGAYAIGKSRIPFMFLSLTNEVCEDGCREMRVELAQLPLSMFDSFASDLLSRSVIVHQYTEGIQQRKMEKIMHEYGANVAFMQTVRDEDGKITGFISAVYTDKPSNNEFTKEYVTIASQRVSAILAS